MKVHLGSVLHGYTAGRSTIEGRGATLRELLADLETRHPGLRFRVVDEQGGLRPHLRFHLGDRWAQSLDDPIGADAEVHILGALSGG